MNTVTRQDDRHADDERPRSRRQHTPSALVLRSDEKFMGYPDLRLLGHHALAGSPTLSKRLFRCFIKWMDDIILLVAMHTACLGSGAVDGGGGLLLYIQRDEWGTRISIIRGSRGKQRVGAQFPAPAQQPSATQCL